MHKFPSWSHFTAIAFLLFLKRNIGFHKPENKEGMKESKKTSLQGRNSKKERQTEGKVKRKCNT